jgi:hypothetical protein
MFKISLPEEARAQLERERQEIERLFHLTDRVLGETLLTLARACRTKLPDKLKPNSISYESGLVWDLIPEIAKRLGCSDFEPNERGNPQHVNASNVEPSANPALTPRPVGP